MRHGRGLCPRALIQLRRVQEVHVVLQAVQDLLLVPAILRSGAAESTVSLRIVESDQSESGVTLRARLCVALRVVALLTCGARMCASDGNSAEALARLRMRVKCHSRRRAQGEVP